MTAASWTAIGHENVVETYSGLAASVVGVREAQLDGCRLFAHKTPLSLCNFAIDFRTTSEELGELADQLAQLNRERPHMRIFVVDGDQPAGIGRALTDCGLTKLGVLTQMVYSEQAGPSIELVLSSNEEERTRLAKFMVANFFWRREMVLRTTIVEATVSSPHQLYGAWIGQELVGAVMLSETARSMGLYNLCVEPRRRKRGVGTRIVQACAQIADTRSKALVLQTEARLVPWYENNGFRSFGFVETYGIGSRIL